MGDRACVDTAALLLPGEGLLLGSFAGGFFLVLSEALESGFIAARPFRVNAGAVCNYCLQGERTAYLSELAAGASVTLTDAQGRTRDEVVGRVKLERRPMIMLEAEAQAGDGARFSVLLQNAETVRVATPSGGSASVSELRVGDAVLLALASTAARHSGIAVLEECCEK
jgi:3-dehydroquinate synthase II